MSGVTAVFYVAMFVKDIEFPTVMPVKNIQVEGKLNFLDENEIGLTVKNNIAGGYFTVDLKHVRDILLHEPWIKQASLRRQWPEGISVFVEEKKPVAYWNGESFISMSGDVFKPDVSSKKLNLPELNGPEGQHVNVWKFMNVLYQEMTVLDYEIRRLNLDNRRAWQIEIARHVNSGKAEAPAEKMKNGINVRLGRFDTEKRMQRFVRILPALTDEMKQKGKIIKVIDMRYPNGFAVQVSEA